MLYAFYEYRPIIGIYKLKRCLYRDKASGVYLWLNIFRYYRVCGGGLGARYIYCRFLLLLYWRMVYREEMDLKYGSEMEV